MEPRLKSHTSFGPTVTSIIVQNVNFAAGAASCRRIYRARLIRKLDVILIKPVHATTELVLRISSTYRQRSEVGVQRHLVNDDRHLTRADVAYLRLLVVMFGRLVKTQNTAFRFCRSKRFAQKAVRYGSLVLK